jgi:flagellar basal body-associated protein FliL
VFRVAGVINVLLGWFLTAFIAFLVAALFAFVMVKGGVAGTIGLIIVVAASFAYTFVLHNKMEARKDRIAKAIQHSEIIPAQKIISDTIESIAQNIESVRDLYQLVIDGLSREDRTKLRKAHQTLKKVKLENEEFRYAFYASMRRVAEERAEGSRTYLLAYDLMQDFNQSAILVADTARQHVEDVLAPLDQEQHDQLEEIARKLSEFMDFCVLILRNKDFERFQEMKLNKKKLYADIESLLARQTTGIKEKSYSARNSLLFFSILLETKDLIAVTARFVKMYHSLETLHTNDEPWVLVAGIDE